MTEEPCALTAVREGDSRQTGGTVAARGVVMGQTKLTGPQAAPITVWAALLCGFGPPAALHTQAAVVIEHVAVAPMGDGDVILRDQAVVIVDGRIQVVGPTHRTGVPPGARRVDVIKVHDFLPPAAWAAIVDRAVARGARVTGHLSPTVSLADAVARGQSHVQHLGPELLAVCTPDAKARVDAWYGEWIRGGMTAFAEGSTGFWAGRDPATCAATLRGLGAGVIVTPTVSHRLVTEAASAAVGRWLDSTARAACESSLEDWTRVDRAARDRYRATLHSWLRAAHDAGIRIVAGTDGPGGCQPPGTIALELEELVAAGLTPLAALRAATRNAADAYGADSLGRVAAGQVADLVLLDASVLSDVGRVRDPWLVVRGGHIVGGTRRERR